MPDHEADRPADQKQAGESSPTVSGPGADPTPDDFTPLPRKRFWRGRSQRPPATEPWWQRLQETDPED